MCNVIEANFPATLVVLIRQLKEAVNSGTRSEAQDLLDDIEPLVADGMAWFRQMQEAGVVAVPMWTEFMHAKER